MLGDEMVLKGKDVPANSLCSVSRATVHQEQEPWVPLQHRYTGVFTQVHAGILQKLWDTGAWRYRSASDVYKKEEILKILDSFRSRILNFYCARRLL